MSNHEGSGIERRRAKRREVLDRFSFYICIPKLGHTRHKVNDVSELGIGFSLETLGEFRLQNNETCELQFYLNQSLYLQLKIKVMRQKDENSIQDVGAEFLETETKQHQTFLTLVRLLDQVTESGEFQN